MDTITLSAGQQIEITVDGRNLIVGAEQDSDGTTFVVLGSNDSNLQGYAPGEYYLVPRGD